VSKSETEPSRARNITVEKFTEAVAALRRGDVIVFPTETLYGLGADALNSVAVEKIFELKGRELGKPIPLIVADRAMLDSIVAKVPRAAEILIERFWPGPLTLVLPGRKDLPRALLNAAGSVGIRVSSQPIAQQLVDALLRPLTATSANPAGKHPARTIEEARSYFGDRLEVFVDGGTLTSKSGSTVVEISGERVLVLREGEIALSDLQAVLGDRRDRLIATGIKPL
jgi:L-threonylcarbamoyladenylate synthase